MKKSFLIHQDSLVVLDALTDEQAGKLFRAIRAYHEGNLGEMDQMIAIAFAAFRAQFMRDDDKYIAVCERNTSNGAKGGRPKKEKPNQTEKTQSVILKPKKADSDSDSDSDSDRIPPTPLPEVSISSNAEIPSGEITRPARKREPKKVWKAPELDEVIAYFRAEGYSDQAANKFFKYYSAAEPPWHDSRGNPVKGWKQKAQSVWFKPENETKAKEIQATSGTRSEYVMGQRFNPRTGEPIRTT